jgi:hypothetical protein
MAEEEVVRQYCFQQLIAAAETVPALESQSFSSYLPNSFAIGLNRILGSKRFMFCPGTSKQAQEIHQVEVCVSAHSEGYVAIRAE